MEAKNPAIYRTTLSFTKRVRDFLLAESRKMLGSPFPYPAPTRDWLAVDESGKLVYQTAFDRRHHTNLFPFWHSSVFDDWDETKVLLETLAADSAISRHFDHLVGAPGLGSLRISSRDYLLAFAATAWHMHLDHADWDKESFQSLFHQVESLFYSSTLTIRIWGFLENAWTPVENFEFGRDIVLRGLSLEEFVNYWNRFDNIREIFPVHTLFGREARPFPLLERVERVDKIISDDPGRDPGERPSDDTDFQRVLAGLLLSTGMEVGLSRVRRTCDNHPFLPGGGMSVFGNIIEDHNGGNKLDESHLRSAREHFEALCECDSDKMTLVTRRYISATRRSDHLDRTLDIAIALEVLYLSIVHGQDTNDELTYRLSLTAAFLLGRDHESRKAMFTRVRNFYRARSSIVHNGILKTQHHFAANDGEPILRESLKEVLRLMRSGTSIDADSIVFGRPEVDRSGAAE